MKRKPGRPKGSKNKITTEKTSIAKAAKTTRRKYVARSKDEVSVSLRFAGSSPIEIPLSVMNDRKARQALANFLDNI